MKRSPLQRTTLLVRTEGPAKAEIKPKKCKSCKKEFTPLRMGQKACSPACALELAKSPSIKSERRHEKARKGKQAPTLAESAWMDSITAIGCIACLIDGHPDTPGAVHHLLQGGRRMGHMFTICLCDPGHHQNGQQFGKISRHPWKARFEAQYGTERELLEMTEQLVARGLA